jgi:hypothetical protein
VAGARLAALAVCAGILVAGLATAAGASAAVAYMSCGTPPTSYFGEEFPGRITYKRHPHRCYYSEDGSTAALVNLVGIRWRNWGGERASARAKRVDNHDMDRNGFQRHPVRVVLSDLEGAVGHAGSRKLYYTRMEVFDQGRSYVIHLFRPGQEPVRF